MSRTHYPPHGNRPRAFLDTDPLLYEHRAAPAFPAALSTNPRLRDEFRRMYEGQYGEPWRAHRAHGYGGGGGSEPEDTEAGSVDRRNPVMVGMGGATALYTGGMSPLYRPAALPRTPSGPVFGARRSTQTRQRIVTIDSRDRNWALFPSASRFRIDLPEEILNVRRVRLASLEFPHNEQLIRSQPLSKRNNKLYWINNTLEEQNTIYSITIDDGNYTSSSFSAELLKKLNQVERLTLNRGLDRKYHRFTITMDAVRNILTLRNAERTTLARPFTCFTGSNYIESKHERHNFIRGQLIFVENAQAFGGIPVELINTNKHIELVVESLDRLEAVNSVLVVTVGTTRHQLAGLAIGALGQRTVRLLGNEGGDVQVYDRVKFGSHRRYTVTRVSPTGILELAEPLEEDLGDTFLIQNYLGDGLDAVEYVGRDPETGEDIVRLKTVTHKLRALEGTPGLTPRTILGLDPVVEGGDTVTRYLDEAQEEKTNDLRLGIYTSIQRELAFHLPSSPDDLFYMRYVSRPLLPDASSFTVRGNILDWVILTADTTGLGKTFEGLMYPDGMPLPPSERPSSPSGTGPFRLETIRMATLRGWHVLFDGRDQRLWACPPWDMTRTVTVQDRTYRTFQPWLFAPKPETPTWWTDLGFYRLADASGEGNIGYTPGTLGYTPTLLAPAKRRGADVYSLRHGDSSMQIVNLKWVEGQWVPLDVKRLTFFFTPLTPMSVLQLVTMIQTTLESVGLFHIVVRYDEVLSRIVCQDTQGGAALHNWGVIFESPQATADNVGVSLATALGFEGGPTDGLNAIWTFQATHALYSPSISKTGRCRFRDFAEYATGNPAFVSKERGYGRVTEEEGVVTVSSLPAVLWTADVRTAVDLTTLGADARLIQNGYRSDLYPIDLVPNSERNAITGSELAPLPASAFVAVTRNLHEVKPIYQHSGLRTQQFTVQDDGWHESGTTVTHHTKWPLLYTGRCIVVEDTILSLLPPISGRPMRVVAQVRYQGMLPSMDPPIEDLVYLDGGVHQVLPLDSSYAGRFWLARTTPRHIAAQMITSEKVPSIPYLQSLLPDLYSLPQKTELLVQPGYLLVPMSVAADGLTFTVPGSAVQVDPELLTRRSPETLLLPLGCVVDLLFEEDIGEPFLYSTVPDGEHSYGRGLDFFSSRQTWTPLPQSSVHPFRAVQRIDMRFETLAGFPFLPVSESLRRLGVVAELFPYLPSYPGACGSSRIWICLPPIENAVWVQALPDPLPDPYFPVLAGNVVSRLPSGHLVCPLHRLEGPTHCMLGSDGMPASETLSPVQREVPEEFRYMYLEVNTRLTKRTTNTQGEVIPVPQRVYYPIRWVETLFDLVTPLKEALQDYLNRVNRSEALPLVEVLGASDRPATYRLGFQRNKCKDCPAEYWTEARDALRDSATGSVGDGNGTLRLWFQTPPELDEDALFHSSARLWGWPSGSVVELSRRFEQLPDDQILWETVSTLVHSQDVTRQHLAVASTSTFTGTWSKPVFWHVPLVVDATTSAWSLRGPLQGIPGSELPQRWTTGQLIALGEGATRLHRVLSLSATPNRKHDVLTLRQDTVGALLEQEPVAYAAGTIHALYEAVDTDFIFTRYQQGDYVQPFQSEILQSPGDERFFSTSDQTNWSVVEVSSLFQVRLSPLTSPLWLQTSATLDRWNHARYHKAYYLKNNMRYYLQTIIPATETRTERGGNAVDIGSGVPYALLFDRSDTPADILGFPRVRTEFRTLHNNTVLDSTYQSAIVSTQPGSGNKRFLTRVETAAPHGLMQGETVFIQNHRGSSNDDGINDDEGHLVVLDDMEPSNVFYIPLQIERGGLRGNVYKRRIYRPYMLTGDNYVYITSPQLSSAITTSSRVRNVLAKVLLNTPPGAVLFNSYVSSDRVFEQGALANLRRLDLEVVDPNGEPYDFLNVDWSMTLEVEHEVDVIQGSYMSSRTGNVG